MIVFPGDHIESTKKPSNGINKSMDGLMATKAGVLKESKKFVGVVNSQKRYVPNLGDFVIGRVSYKTHEFYRVDIGSAYSATLDALSFEGASKRNRPNLIIGSLVYCQVTLADKDLDPEVVCVNAAGKADGMGELLEGYMITCSLGMASSLTNNNHPILKRVSEIIPFELVAGVNGRVWVKASTIKSQILLMNLIQSADGLPPSELSSLISLYCQKLKEVS
jgi:exosome complex component RRP40